MNSQRFSMPLKRPIELENGALNVIMLNGSGKDLSGRRRSLQLVDQGRQGEWVLLFFMIFSTDTPPAA
ncbi:hypothetical protein [Streptomyces melanogenes]|uniref:Uncharacterized protein n=1 Tax=Streptomyces melanogenes TaxID=67326 RepID=A0ABZ1XS56_9ACTN|nr:hypothetical protein [Streptomyces melanogenes]